MVSQKHLAHVWIKTFIFLYSFFFEFVTNLWQMSIYTYASNGPNHYTRAQFYLSYKKITMALIVLHPLPLAWWWWPCVRPCDGRGWPACYPRPCSSPCTAEQHQHWHDREDRIHDICQIFDLGGIPDTENPAWYRFVPDVTTLSGSQISVAESQLQNCLCVTKCFYAKYAQVWWVFCL